MCEFDGNAFVKRRQLWNGNGFTLGKAGNVWWVDDRNSFGNCQILFWTHLCASQGHWLVHSRRQFRIDQQLRLPEGLLLLTRRLLQHHSLLWILRHIHPDRHLLLQLQLHRQGRLLRYFWLDGRRLRHIPVILQLHRPRQRGFRQFQAEVVGSLGHWLFLRLKYNGLNRQQFAQPLLPLRLQH